MLSDVRTIVRGLDTSGVYTDEEIRDKLIPLLDHENLVRLMDIQFSQAKQINMAYLGFEHMSRGSLNRILFEKVYVISSPSSLYHFLFLWTWVNGFDEGTEFWRKRERGEKYILMFLTGCFCLAQGDTGEFMLACARGSDDCFALAALRV